MDKIKEVGLGNIIIEAMRQAFFTLSVGMGSMMIFGSYIGKERALVGEGITISPRRISIIYFVIFSTPFWSPILQTITAIRTSTCRRGNTDYIT